MPTDLRPRGPFHRPIRSAPWIRSGLAVASFTALLVAASPVGAAGLIVPGPGHVAPAPMATHSWTLLNGSAHQPPTRQSGAMVYDVAAKEYVLFGGAAATGQPLGDTWVFAHGAWKQLALHHSPAARWYFGMTYDPVLQKVVLFGGRDTFSDFNDTWLFNGTHWAKLSTPVAPPPLTTSRMVWDARDGYVLLFGGYSIMSGAPSMYNFTWTFANGAWTNRSGSVSGAPPDVHITTYAVYDPAAGYVLMFGGYFSYAASCTTPGFTWAYAQGRYVNLTPLLRTAPPLGGAGSRMMAADPSVNGVVLYGGWGGFSCSSYYNGTWTYSGGAWHQLPLTTNPGPLWDGAMAANSAARSVLLFSGNTVVGGSGQLNQTWQFR